MRIKITTDNLEIRVHSRQFYSEISINHWDKLSSTSIYANPFYESWNLIPALKYLDYSDEVFIVTIIRHNDLVALFPVIIDKLKLGIKTLSLWIHDHCYLSTPLMNEYLNINQLLCIIGLKLKTQWALVYLHDPKLFQDFNNDNIHSSIDHRAAIFNPTNIKPHLDSLPRKIKKELTRTHKNLNKQLAIKFHHHNNLTDGLNRYRTLEHKGWKGRDKGSINSKAETIKYYEEIMSNDNCKEFIQFQELISHEICLASSIRFKSKSIFFEVKTCYDETYGRHNPGKLLEIDTLNNLMNDQFLLVDSCTQKDNKLINRLWPDRISLETSYIFYPTILSNTLRIIHKLKQKLSTRD